MQGAQKADRRSPAFMTDRARDGRRVRGLATLLQNCGGLRGFGPLEPARWQFRSLRERSALVVVPFCRTLSALENALRCRRRRSRGGSLALLSVSGANEEKMRDGRASKPVSASLDSSIITAYSASAVVSSKVFTVVSFPATNGFCRFPGYIS